jgi:hypothetical protein
MTSDDLVTMSEEAAEGTEFQDLMHLKPFGVFHKTSQLLVSLNLYDPNRPRVDIRLLSRPIGLDGRLVATKCGCWFDPEHGRDLIRAIEKCLKKAEDLPARSASVNFQKQYPTMQPLTRLEDKNKKKKATTTTATTLKQPRKPAAKRKIVSIPDSASEEEGEEGEITERL